MAKDLTITISHEEVCMLLTTLGVVGMSATNVPDEVRRLAISITEKIANASGDHGLKMLPGLMRMAAACDSDETAAKKNAPVPPKTRLPTDPSLN